jgi:rhamnose transport system permease protein
VTAVALDRPPLLQRIRSARELPVVAILIAVIAITSAINPRFVTPQGVRDTLLAVSFIALMAVGQTFVIVMRHVDLSVGSTLGLSAYLSALAVQHLPGPSLLVLVLAGALVGIAVGIVNGTLVAWLRLPALVVTLGTLYVVQGVQALLVGPRRVSASALPEPVIRLGVETFLGVPYLMWVAIVAAAIGTWVLRSTTFGRDLYAMGSNPTAAELVGIPITSRTVRGFLISGMTAGMAGALVLARFAGTDANAGRGVELSVVAACVVGGVFIFGGSGSPAGALIGAVLLKVLALSLIALSISPFWQEAMVGLLLLAAITIDRISVTRAERRRRLEAQR